MQECKMPSTHSATCQSTCEISGMRSVITWSPCIHVHTKSASRKYCKTSEPVEMCQVGCVVFSIQLLDCKWTWFSPYSKLKWAISFTVEFSIGISWMFLLYGACIIDWNLINERTFCKELCVEILFLILSDFDSSSLSLLSQWLYDFKAFQHVPNSVLSAE